MSNKIRIQLFGGEQDGFERDVTVPSGRPEFFYVWPARYFERVNKTPQRDKAKLEAELSTLAYKYKEAKPKTGVTGSMEYRYERCAKKDRKAETPAR